jgi:N-acetylated-alpha-linked acidic dipeptidase
VFVFVNLGHEDYLELERRGVVVRNRVAVAVRGGGYRGGVVMRVTESGVVAVLIAGHVDGGVERGMVLLGGPGECRAIELCFSVVLDRLPW